MFAQPDGCIHHESGDQSEGLVTHSEASRLRYMWRVVHVDLNLTDCWRIHLTIQNLGKTKAFRKLSERLYLQACLEYKFRGNYRLNALGGDISYLISQLAVFKKSQLVLAIKPLSINVTQVNLKTPNKII